MSTDRQLSPARRRAQLARVDAELAEARRRRELLEFERDITPHTSGYRDPEEIDVAIAKVDATIAELEADREELSGAAAPPSPVAVPNDVPVPEYASTREAAALLGVSPRTLEGLRLRGDGPPHIRIGRRVLYPIASLRSPAK